MKHSVCARAIAYAETAPVRRSCSTRRTSRGADTCRCTKVVSFKHRQVSGGLLDDGRKLGWTSDRALARHVEGRMAVFRAAGQSRTHAACLGETQNVDSVGAACTISEERRVLGPTPRQCVAMESRARRHALVAARTCGVLALALIARRRFLDRAQHA